MNVMTDVQSVGANATTNNILSGKIGEFVERPSSVRIGILGAAVGVFATVIIGGNVLLDDQEVGNAATMPVDPDNIIVETGAVPGDQIVIRLRNSTGAAIICKTLTKTIPLA